MRRYSSRVQGGDSVYAQNPPHKYPIYLFMIRPIGHLTVGKQTELDLVIMVWLALNMASMKLSFFLLNEEKRI